MIRAALNNKAANLWVLKRKDQNQLPVLIVPQEGLDNGTTFSGLVSQEVPCQLVAEF